MSRLPVPALLLILAASIAAGPPAPAPAPGGCGGSYRVVRGDTVYSIARRCHSTVVAIAGASRLNDPRRIEIGQILRIPDGPDVPFPFKPEEDRGGGAALTYLFQPSDTLYSLARWARVGVPALLAANPGINPHKIEIGDEIRLPAGAVRPEAARARERGPAPMPAVLRRYETPPPPAAAPPPRRLPVAPPPPRLVEPPRPAPPPRPKPDDDEREPEGM